MSADLLVALTGFAVASSITPGPHNLLVLTSGLNHGVPLTLPLVAGISLGFVLMLIAVGIGLGAIIQASPALHVAIKLFGLLYMLWLAWKIATSAPAVDAMHGDGQAPLSAFDGAVFQWVNPKAWAVALTATATYSIPGAAMTGLAWIACVFAVVALASLSLWAAFGTLMRRLVDSRSKMRTFNAAMTLLLVASAMPVAYDLATHR